MHIYGNYRHYYPISAVYTPLCTIPNMLANYILIVPAGNYVEEQTTVLPSIENI